MNQLVPLSASHAPTLVQAVGARANALLGILCLQHPQPARAPRRCAPWAGNLREAIAAPLFT